MSFYYLNPEDEPRDCRCSCHTFATTNPDEAERWNHWKASHACECGGTGRLGIEGAEPDVEVCEFLMNDEPIGFFWRRAGDDSLGCWCGDPNGSTTVTTFKIEEAALAAAREAHKCEEMPFEATQKRGAA